MPPGWSFAPGVVAGLAALGVGYARGAAALRRRSRWTDGVPRPARSAFWAGWSVLALALTSPLHALGEALFSAHMVQHIVLMTVAAPLLVVGQPVVVLLWALPDAVRAAVARLGRMQWLRAVVAAAAEPGGAWAIQASAILLWHLPPLYGWSVHSEGGHALQHLSFLGSAMLFWHALLARPAARRRYGAAVLYLFTTAVYTGGLGALLTVAPRPLYPVYSTTTVPWGLSPLEDQQLAGLLMWVPGGLIYLVAALALGAMLLRESGQRMLRWEAGR